MFFHFLFFCFARHISRGMNIFISLDGGEDVARQRQWQGQAKNVNTNYSRRAFDINGSRSADKIQRSGWWRGWCKRRDGGNPQMNYNVHLK